MMQKRALLSANNKKGLLPFAEALREQGYELVSTGGTAKMLADGGLPVTLVEDVTGFPECLDGRVKTLHPNVFAGLLAIRGNTGHEDTLKSFNIAPFDVVAVNLYPFAETVAKPGCSLAEAIENIDIGGPSMIRAAAKNYASVAVVTDPAQYGELIEKIKTDTNDISFRLALAAKAFSHTAAYDAIVSNYLTNTVGEEFPANLTMAFTRQARLRYGENPDQAAAFYVKAGENVQGIESAVFLHGKELSYNNIADAQSAVALARDFEEPVCVAVKHATPCGVAVGENVLEAYTRAYECDPQSIFGGIISFNREVDEATAAKMHEIFLEVIIAPSYSEEAFKILSKKKNLRLLQLPMEGVARHARYEFKSAGGGMLVQSPDNNAIALETHETVTHAAPTQEQLKDMVFAMKVVRYVKSNAIVVAKDGRTLGLGGGQVSRIWAAEGAVNHANAMSMRALQAHCQPPNGVPLGAVMASDAMFPFPDVVELCAKAGIAAIMQPGGSKNDRASIDACNKHGIAMVFTDKRHFKH